MTRPLTLVVYMALLTWIVILVASMAKSRGWTFEGFKLAIGNREHMPTTAGLAGRMERTAANTMENFVFFAVLVLVAHVGGAAPARVALGAEIFFWARLVYVPAFSLWLPSLFK